MRKRNTKHKVTLTPSQQDLAAWTAAASTGGFATVERWVEHALHARAAEQQQTAACAAERD